MSLFSVRYFGGAIHYQTDSKQKNSIIDDLLDFGFINFFFFNLIRQINNIFFYTTVIVIFLAL